MMTLKWSSIRQLAIFLITCCIVLFSWANFKFGISSFYIFIFLYVFCFLFYLPRKILSPLNIVFAYYGLWFVLAPMFGYGFQGGVLDTYEYQLSYSMVSTTFIFILASINLGQFIGYKINIVKLSVDIICLSISKLLFLYLMSTLMVVLVVLNSGGFSVWFDNPGDAFLNRSGSGIYVIFSHFFSLALALYSGVFSYIKRRYVYLFIFIVWLVITSPVHGSKFQIILLGLVSSLAWMINVKTISKITVLVVTFAFTVFIVGMVFRGAIFTDLDSLIRILGYFSTLHNLAISVRDLPPDFMTTFFLPFNKFLTPFGLSNGVAYFDMNHLLTDIYYPKAWEIRATEQWPVETDLYLNFHFFGGLPVISIYMFVVGLLYGYADKSRSIGFLFASLMISVLLVSHLRGSLYNHTDFYMLPYVAFMCFIFRNNRLN